MELALYDEALGRRPQIVAFNKIDQPEAQERWPAIQTELKSRGIEPIAISAAGRLHVTELLQRAFREHAALPEDAAVPEAVMPVYELPPEEVVFEVAKIGDGEYRVTGKRIERAARLTYWDYEEAVLRFQRTLDFLGVTEALRNAGVQEGDTVYIGDNALEWSD
jgi:GTP-binding protein